MTVHEQDTSAISIDDDTEDVYEDDDDYEEDYEYENPKFYGDSANIYNPMWWAKSHVQGQTTLAGLAADLRAWADDVQQKADRGWELSMPTDNGYVWTLWTGDGPPPPEDSHYINGSRADGSAKKNS